MSHHRRLRALFAGAVPLTALGCSSLQDDFTTQSCVLQEGGIADLAPAEGIDFVAVRSVPPVPSASGVVAEATTVSSWGEACASAADAAACAAALEALPLEPSLFQDGQVDIVSVFDVAFTRGDEVGRATTTAELLELLANIDAPSEAVLVARAEGHQSSCDQGNVRESSSGGFVVLAQQGNTCGGDLTRFEVEVAADGSITFGEEEVEHGDPNCAIGRRPAALRSRTRRGRAVGQMFAGAAHLETASVEAFVQLAGELAAHGAPRALVRAAWRARGDEIRHAAATGALARRFGAVPPAPRYDQRWLRPLAEVARDNATEGCVRETFGALLATVQAARARDRNIRRELRRIAVDETRHAALSWALDAWARTRLGAWARRDLDAARQEAVARLRADLAAPTEREVELLAGMPGVEERLRLAGALERTLWRSERRA